MKSINLKFLFLLVLFGSFKTVYAQENTGGLIIDKIIGRVDDYIVLKSELESTYLDILSRGERISGNTKCAVFKDLVTNKLLVAKAEIDSIIVEDVEVNQELNSRMAMIINQIGSEDEIEKYYNKTISEFKKELFDDIKEQLVARRMQQEILTDITVSPEEVKEFYAEIPKDSIPYFSTQVKVSQIVKIPEIGKDQKDKVKDEIMKIRDRISNGESFEILATLYSQDPGSAQNGGNLGFAGRGSFQPEYEAAALKLKPGEVSMPVETKFGFHLIELIEKRGNLFSSRHILLQPTFSDEDIKNTKNYLDSLAKLAFTVDSISFEDLARLHSDDKFTSSFGGYFTDSYGSEKVLVEELDPVVFFTIDTMDIGQISIPIETRLDDGTSAYKILFYKERIPPHLGNLTEDYQRFRNFTLNRKQSKILDIWFERAKEDVFINIDPEYSSCNIN
jgi:peptidyl-prolyl cis-trans isomerase SurA|tara:strand:+ start:61922 stop:63265 length:1344 start_codon:yes stop_codon:yes gene_type:complete